MSKTRELAQFITELRYRDLPGSVVEKAKEISLDAWGVQLAASTLPWSKLVYRFGRSQGGVPESTVVNYGIRTSAANAAFINGAFGHGFEMDDNHARTSIKGGCITAPSALAIGEQQLSSGKDFITAVVAGYEVMTRVGLTVAPGLWKLGNHPTGTIGAFGAATVAGKLLDLDEGAMVHALGGAGAHMVGFSEVPAGGRGHIKRIFGGMAAAGGIRAALLAGAGMTGPETTLDADSGFCRAFDVDEANIDTLTNGLADDWEILKVHFKIYAQDGYIQPMTEALERIRKTNSFNAKDIEQVWVGTNRHACHETVGLIREPKDLTDAQFSANFSVALYLVKGGAGFYEYTEENLHDPQVRDLSRRVVLEVDEQIEREFIKTRPRGANVAVRLKSGEEYKERVHNLRTMMPEEVDEKFRKLSTVVLDKDRSERLLSMARRLDDVRDVSTLVPLLIR